MARMTCQNASWGRAARAIAVVLVMAAGIVPALAGDDDDEDETIDTKILRQFLGGLGLRGDNGSQIDYHERSPLVVPPTRTLPPPQSAATSVDNNPAWPKDRDVARRKPTKKAAAAAVPSVEEDMRMLRPNELQGNRPAGRGNAGEPAANPDGTRAGQLSPSQLGFNGFGSVFNRDGKVVQFTGEPPRASLTEPPAGLRTPSSKYPYGSKGVLEADKNSFDRGTVTQNQQ